MKKIQDEFTNLNISRERKRQLRKIKKGTCFVASCANNIYASERCIEHYKKEILYKRKINSYKGGIWHSKHNKIFYQI